MRVVVTEAFRAYLNMQPEAFVVGQKLKGSTAAYMLEVGAAVKPLDDEARDHLAALAAPDGTVVPDPPAELDIEASVAVVLSWVGEDQERAAVALVAERAKEKPRSGLVKSLEKLTAPVES